jgi:hypothetical protein
MECLGVYGPQWVYEPKLDGCHAIKFRKGTRLLVKSHNEMRRVGESGQMHASGLNDAFAFFDGVDFVDGRDLKGFLCAARPQDFDAIDLCGPAKAEVQALV